MLPQIIQHQVNYLETNPEVGASLSIGHVFIAFFIQIFDSGRINPVIMDLFQLGAWTIAMIVGIISIIGFIKKAFSFTNKASRKKP